MRSRSAQELLPLVQQAKLLAKQYDAVIANPAVYGRYLNQNLKTYLKRIIKGYEKDLFSAFYDPRFAADKESGFNSLVLCPHLFGCFFFI